jgi:hypothetical protein
LYRPNEVAGYESLACLPKEGVFHLRLAAPAIMVPLNDWLWRTRYHLHHDVVMLVLSIPVLFVCIFATWQNEATSESHAEVIAEFRHVAGPVGIGSGLLLCSSFEATQQGTGLHHFPAVRQERPIEPYSTCGW